MGRENKLVLSGANYETDLDQRAIGKATSSLFLIWFTFTCVLFCKFHFYCLNIDVSFPKDKLE